MEGARQCQSTSGLELDHIMRSSFALAGRADADETGFVQQLSEIGRAQVTESGLDAAD